MLRNGQKNNFVIYIILYRYIIYTTTMENKDTIYIVFCYHVSPRPTKYVIGVYTDEEQAVTRQKEYCGDNWQIGLNTSITGDNICTFINTFPCGDGYKQIFTN